MTAFLNLGMKALKKKREREKEKEKAERERESNRRDIDEI